MINTTAVMALRLAWKGGRNEKSTPVSKWIYLINTTNNNTIAEIIYAAKFNRLANDLFGLFSILFFG
jgi:hypothetical protein